MAKHILMEKALLSKESFKNYQRFEDPSSSNAFLKKDVRTQNFVTYMCLFESDLYSINDLNCYFDCSHTFVPNYSRCFSINIPRKGYFTFRSYKQTSEEYASRMALEKPGCEFSLVQEEPGPGGCTVLSFSDEGYRLILERVPKNRVCFFTDPDWFSAAIDGHAGTDYLHYRILHLVRDGSADPFEVDCLVMELVGAVVDIVLDENPLHQPPYSVRCHHLRTVERAKEFLLEYFSQVVSLKQLARHCYVSEFHFSRLFRQLCGYSAFDYLQQLRLKHAEVLLSKADLPIKDVAYQSGFTRADYFSDAFTKKYGMSPKQFKEKASR